LFVNTCSSPNQRHLITSRDSSLYEISLVIQHIDEIRIIDNRNNILCSTVALGGIDLGDFTLSQATPNVFTAQPAGRGWMLPAFSNLSSCNLLPPDDLICPAI
jgi:hypothetical protein